MLLKVSAYLIFLTILFLLPEKFFSLCLQKMNDLQVKLRALRDRLPVISTVAA